MPARLIIAALLLAGSVETAVAQSTMLPEDQNDPRRASSNSDTYRSKVDLNANVANPFANPATPSRKPSNIYGKEANPYAPNISATSKNTGVSPAEAAAARQSGVTDADARSILQQQGYTGVAGLRAEPNSVWVWQADAIKNGRRTRLGIDYRGNLMELGAAQPCSAPGQGFGLQSPLGTGVRLSEASRCTNQ
jgi:hypothetical protein